jgi:hypothetical protein
MPLVDEDSVADSDSTIDEDEDLSRDEDMVVSALEIQSSSNHIRFVSFGY